MIANKLNRRYKRKTSLLGLLLVLFAACSTMYTSTGPKWNLSAIYNPASSRMHPSYRVYHNADDRSLLLIKLFPNELLFNQANPTGEFLSKVSVQVQNFEITDNTPVLADSITYTYNIKQANVGRRFLTQIPFKAEEGKRYQLRIVARDILRRDFNLQFIDVDKTSRFSQQNFNVLNPQNVPYFNNVLRPGAAYRIEHRDKSFQKLYINYFKNQTPLPSPTFATRSDEMVYGEPDSAYVLEYTPEMMISFSYEGLYHFRFDTTTQEGLSIVNFGDNFPKINTGEELLKPLVYITTSAEYKNLLSEENAKLTNDNFWLNLGGSTSKARELIRIYYNRVYFANYYFSTNKPGWKTDRGMVYIVYGPPQNMQKTPNTETWIYYFKGASNSVEFTFNYNPTPYSIDNYTLSRSESHDWHWREAVDTWRGGQVFLAN